MDAAILEKQLNFRGVGNADGKYVSISDFGYDLIYIFVLFVQKYGFEKSGFLTTVLLEPGLIRVIPTHNKILKSYIILAKLCITKIYERFEAKSMIPWKH